jgi:hypothetical protein
LVPDDDAERSLALANRPGSRAETLLKRSTWDLHGARLQVDDAPPDGPDPVAVSPVGDIVARWGSSVDVVGHSQGGIEPRWALRWWPGMRSMVAHYIGLASPNHGIDAADVCAGSGNCGPAVWQMAQGSRLLAALNRGSEAPGPTSYTTGSLRQPRPQAGRRRRLRHRHGWAAQCGTGAGLTHPRIGVRTDLHAGGISCA